MAAEQTQNNQARNAKGFFEIEINGKMMLELQKIGQPQGWKFVRIIGPGQCCDLAVSSREYYNIGG